MRLMQSGKLPAILVENMFQQCAFAHKKLYIIYLYIYICILETPDKHKITDTLHVNILPECNGGSA
jgi:hypothetical protein